MTPKLLNILASLKPYLIVFVASACGLILEIVAARILAPSIGVSLYTWTSIIGVVLAGIRIGNYVGGRVADRFPSPTTLGIILLAGGAHLPDRAALVGRCLCRLRGVAYLASHRIPHGRPFLRAERGFGHGDSSGGQAEPA